MIFNIDSEYYNSFEKLRYNNKIIINTYGNYARVYNSQGREIEQGIITDYYNDHKKHTSLYSTYTSNMLDFVKSYIKGSRSKYNRSRSISYNIDNGNIYTMQDKNNILASIVIPYLEYKIYLERFQMICLTKFILLSGLRKFCKHPSNIYALNTFTLTPKFYEFYEKLNKVQIEMPSIDTFSKTLLVDPSVYSSKTIHKNLRKHLITTARVNKIPIISTEISKHVVDTSIGKKELPTSFTKMINQSKQIKNNFEKFFTEQKLPILDDINLIYDRLQFEYINKLLPSQGILSQLTTSEIFLGKTQQPRETNNSPTLSFGDFSGYDDNGVPREHKKEVLNI